MPNETMTTAEYRRMKGLPPRAPFDSLRTQRMNASRHLDSPTVEDSARIAEREKGAPYQEAMKRNKHGSVKTEYDGIKFDSKKEARRWRLLKAMQDIEEISELRRQVRYELVPKQEGERACHYVADFVYKHNGSGKTFVEDTKSNHTRKLPLYILKRKLMLQVHQIRISEV